MSDLIERIITRLASPPGSDELNEAILDGAFVFEKHRGVPPAGWSEEVVTTPVTDADVHRLKAALVEFTDRGGHGSWSLGKAYDPSLIPVFCRVMRRELDGDGYELYQAMIALDNLGEDVFARRSLMSNLDVDDNRALARAYLSRYDEAH
jgi:hypothetical protein